MKTVTADTFVSVSVKRRKGDTWGRRGRLGERFLPSSVASALVRRPGCCLDKCHFRLRLPARNLESKEISQAAEPGQTAGSGTEGVASLPPHPTPAQWPTAHCRAGTVCGGDRDHSLGLGSLQTAHWASSPARAAGL